MALPVGAVSAWAQQGSTCAQLEASLASLDRGADSWASRQGQAAKLRGDLDRYSAQARNMGCDAPRGFLIFQGPPRPPQCDQIDDQISRLRSSIAGLEKGGSSDQAGQRRALILALAQNNCGPQYAAAVRSTAAPPQPQRPRNFLEAIFGGPVQSDSEETAPDVDLNAVAPAAKSGGGGSRTVCVRMCDGYFFPLSRGSNSSRYATEDALCKRLCPNADTQLFTLSGDDIRNASSISGQSYMSTPNALRYRKELVSSCSCRAAGQSWAQALAGIEDETTLQKGDILVTEEQAREMSQPKPVDPAPGTKGKSASRATTTTDAAPAGSPAATVAAPLAPASEQPGQRPVRIIPLPRSQNAQQQ